LGAVHMDMGKIGIVLSKIIYMDMGKIGIV
jgi:hypothetical protein